MTHEWPWLIAYWGRKHLIIDQVISYGEKRCDTIPSKADLLFCLGELTLIPPGFGDLPYPTSELARCATQTAERSAIVTAAENGDQMLYIDTLEQSSHVE